MLILRKLKSQGKRKSGGSHGVCASKRLRNWTKKTAWSDWKQQINDSKDATKCWCAAQCSGAQTCSFCSARRTTQWISPELFWLSRWNKFIISNANDQRQPQQSPCPLFATCKIFYHELLLRLFLNEPICFLEILILLMFRFWRSNLDFQHCVGIAPKNHHNHTSLLIFQVIGGIFCSFGSNFCVFNLIFSSKII